MARGARYGGDGDGRVLVRLARGKERRTACRENWYRDFSFSGGRHGRESRDIYQYAALIAIPPKSSRSSWRCAQRGVVYVSPGQKAPRKGSQDSSARNAGLRALTWDYPVEGRDGEPDSEAVLKEINGYTIADRKQIAHIKDLKNDGSTACGAWIYCGVFPEENRNRANEREPKDLLGHGWGFAWPNDCRIIYNRASARPDGQPWSERKKLVWWDAEQKKWTGTDVPDFTEDMDPSTPSNLREGQGVKALGGARPFTLHQDGVGWLFVPSGLKDGPLPAHFEALESFIQNPFYRQQTNPPAKSGNVLTIHTPESRGISVTRMC